MKIQDQVCTREQGKRLHELGISNAAYFQWGSKGEINEEWTIEGPEDDFVPAWTVAELGVMLPEWIVRRRIEYRLLQWHNEPGKAFGVIDEYRLAYRRRKDDIFGEIGDNISGPTEAQARAALLIYLLENKIITPESVNQRLEQ